VRRKEERERKGERKRRERGEIERRVKDVEIDARTISKEAGGVGSRENVLIPFFFSMKTPALCFRDVISKNRFAIRSSSEWKLITARRPLVRESNCSPLEKERKVTPCISFALSSSVSCLFFSLSPSLPFFVSLPLSLPLFLCLLLSLSLSSLLRHESRQKLFEFIVDVNSQRLKRPRCRIDLRFL
jgi:hypothetical protein